MPVINRAQIERMVTLCGASLPEKFRLVLVLHYVEGYRVEEIARIVGRTPSAVKMRLQKGRRLLKEAYQKEDL